MGVLLVGCLLVVAWIAKPAHVRSVVLVVLDTVRADHVSAYGYARRTTPRFDRLASQGLLFERARSVAPWTLPSHASIFTGALPSRHGCTWQHRWLVDRHETMAERLRDSGFDTFGVTTNVNASSLYNLHQGFTTFLETWRLREQHRGLSDSSIADSEIRRWLTTHDAHKPFFLFVNFADAHLPYAPPPPLDTTFGTPSDHARKLAARGDLLQATLTGEEKVGGDDATGLAELYDGDVATADRRLGDLLDLLDELALAEDTVVIVTSDHGEHLGEDGQVDHQLSLDEALLRVPLAVRYPALVKPARIPEPVALTDLKVWIDELAAGRLPAWSPAPDLAPAALFAQYDAPVDLVELVRSHGGDVAPIDRSLACAFEPGAIGAESLKLVRARPGAIQLLGVDRGGHEHPVESVQASAAASLVRLLETAEADHPFVETDEDLVALAPAVVSGADGDRASLDEMRRLGYLGGPSDTGSVGVHASEHWSAGRRALARGDKGGALVELERAAKLAPREPAIRADLEAARR